mmetsp:Transcript_67782/g.126582  ORF Transcript_67782/g.126582 Transcript_67782/m.126582 type:complete len:578 (+) Transcript_67782:141-1874(+)
MSVIIEAEGLDAPFLEKTPDEGRELNLVLDGENRRRRTSSNLASFELADPDILRGAHVATCLACGGSALRDGSPLTLPGLPTGNGESYGWLLDTMSSSVSRCVPVPRRNGTVRQPYDWYEHSFSVTTIDDFWSHSWHAPYLQKLATLLIHYNGLAAYVTSMAVAAIAMVAFAVVSLAYDNKPKNVFLVKMKCKAGSDGVEDGVDPLEDWVDPHCAEPVYFSVWSEVSAIITFLLVLLFWRRKRTVFLDKICIHQTDAEKKAQGVEGISCFLHKSCDMILLWDPSYLERLWCTFEMAAFSKTKNKDTRFLHIRPVIWGQVVIVEMALLFTIGIVDHFLADKYGLGQLAPKGGAIFGMFGELKDKAARSALYSLVFFHTLLFMVSIHWFRVYARGLVKLQVQLNTFTVAQAKCFCCSVNHIDPSTGARMFCDKEAVTECIVEWFGGVDDFELYVQRDLRAHFWKQFGQLGGRTFPFNLCVASSAPRVWAHMDKVSAYWSQQHWHAGAYYLLQGIAYSLILYPMILQFLAFVGQYTYPKPTFLGCTWALDMFKSFLLGLPLGFVIMGGYESLGRLNQVWA